MRQTQISIVRLIPVLLAAMTAFAGEVPISSLAEGAAVRSQYVEAGASDGTDYLFVWVDERTGGAERRATRVTRDGVVLDREGIRLPFVGYRNSVVWTGSSYLIVWGETYPSTIRGLRIDRDGKIIDGPRTLKADAYPMSVLANGSQVVIAYHGHQEPYGPFDKRALFLDDGAEIVADVQLDTDAVGGTTNIAWNGSHFAAVWVDDPEPHEPGYAVEAIRFDVTGALDPAPRQLLAGVSSSYVATPSLASDGTGFVMITRAADDRQAAYRLSSDLATMGLAQLLPALNYELLPQLNISSPVLWNGSHYLILGHDGQAITAVRLNREGRPVGTDVVENTTGAGTLANPVAAMNGHDLLVAWTGRFSADPEIGSDVFGTVVSASTLDPRSRTLLSVGAQQQRRPLVASGGTNLLAVWQEGVALYGRRLALDGSPLDEVPLRLAERGTPSAVVFNGSDYIVVWPQTVSYSVKALKTVRVPRDGPLRADGGTTLADAVPVAAASDGVATLLLWTKENVLYAGRINGDGSLSGEVALTNPEAEAGIGAAAISAGNGEFLVAWEENRLHDMIACPPILTSTIRGTRVSPDLVTLDASGFDIAVAGHDERSPAVTWNGHDWLVVWSAYTGDPSYTMELRGRHVSRAGVAEGAVEGVFITTEAHLPAVTWDGSHYFLTWHETYATKARAGYLTALGRPVASETRLENVILDWSPLAAVPIRPGLAAAAYSRTTSEALYGDVSRAFLNFLNLTPRRRAVR
ncbi:MAG TPA: hypothetical protein VEK57_16655 [Thermoanaerobaculia bacterium]|nr:hypothetical protein [Thermoanaerobaculia bacterium]